MHLDLSKQSIYAIDHLFGYCVGPYEDPSDFPSSFREEHSTYEDLEPCSRSIIFEALYSGYVGEVSWKNGDETPLPFLCI